jgi:hypothetical protein
MATTKELAAWIVENSDLKGTPEFETVAKAYQLSKQKEATPEYQGSGETDPRRGRGFNSDRSKGAPPTQTQGAAAAPPVERGVMEQAGSFVLGATVDPLLGLEQTLMVSPTPYGAMYRGLEGLRGNIVGKLFPEEANAPRGVERTTQQQQAIKERLGVQQGDFDFPRMAGNVFNPLNWFQGKGIVAGTLPQRIQAGAATGALSGATTATDDVDRIVQDRLFNTGFGAFVGGAVPVTIDSAKGIIRIIRDLPISSANKQRAMQKYVLDLVGDDPAKTAAILKEAEDIVPGSRTTAADALADRPEAQRLIKEQQRIASTPQEGPAFARLSAEREAARMNELTRTFGTADDVAAMETTRRQATAPLREQALEQANIYGQVAPRLEADVAARQQGVVSAIQGQGRTATEAAQATNRANTWTPVPGYPRFPGRYSPNAERAVEFKAAADEFGSVVDQRKAEVLFKEMQLKSLKDEGFYPLETKGLLQQIETSLKTPGQRSNALLVDAQQKLADKLRALSDERGIIDSRDLYNVRKEIAQDIGEFLSAKTGNASFTTEASNVEKALKKQLDSAITKASGSGAWEDYLSNYSKYSKKIDQMQVGQEIKKRLGEGTIGDVEKIGEFATAVTKGAASTVKRATGVSRYSSIEEVLDKDQIASVNRVFADLSRTKKADELAKKIRLDSPEFLEGADKTPPMLDKFMTIFKGVMGRLRQGSQAELDAEMSKLLREPQALGLFIEAIPKKDVPNVASALMRRVSPKDRAILEAMFGINEIPVEGAVTRGVISEIGRQ